MSATAKYALAGVRSRAQIPIDTSEERNPRVWARVLGALTSAVKMPFCITNAARKIASAKPYRLGKLVATTHRKEAMPRRRTQGVAGTRYLDTTCTPSRANESTRSAGHAAQVSQKTRRPRAAGRALDRLPKASTRTKRASGSASAASSTWKTE